MIRLSNTTKKLQAVLGGAITTSQPQAVVSFYDENNSGEKTRGADQQTNLNSTTDVDICNALGTNKESYTRNIDTLTIYNRDTVSATVTVKIDDGGTETILVKAALATLETLSYDHESGWKVTTAAGATKMAQASMGIDDLSDVTITSVASGDFLTYNGTAWVNTAPATQAEQETGSSTTKPVTPGRQHFHPSAAKGWCLFDASAGATVSYNVSSVTDVGTGEATVNWATDFSSGNFCSVCSPLAGPMAAMTINGNLAGSSATRNYNQAGVLTDNSGGFIAAFGDQ